MPINLSKNVEKLIMLLENARELAVQHKRLTEASKVIKACGIYAKNLNIDVSSDCFKALATACLDKNPKVLNDMFKNLERKILISNR